MAFQEAMLPGGDMDYHNASFVGAGFDSNDFSGDLVVSTVVSFQSGDGASFVGKIQHSDDDVDAHYTDHPAVAIYGPWESIEGTSAFPIGRSGTKRWIRIRAAIGGTGVNA